MSLYVTKCHLFGHCSRRHLSYFCWRHVALLAPRGQDAQLARHRPLIWDKKERIHRNIATTSRKSKVLATSRWISELCPSSFSGRCSRTGRIHAILAAHPVARVPIRHDRICRRSVGRGFGGAARGQRLFRSAADRGIPIHRARCAGGTFVDKSRQDSQHSWSFTDGHFTYHWQDGFVTHCTLAADGKGYTGTNQQNRRVSGTYANDSQ